MSWLLWAQVASLIVITGIMTHYALSATRTTRTMVLSGALPVEVKGAAE